MKGKHTLGDAPIDPEYIQKMNAIAQALDHTRLGYIDIVTEEIAR